MNEQDLIGYLLLEMEKQNIHITCDDCFPKNAMVNIKRKLMIYNPTKITAFKIAHELSHVINKDICRGSKTMHSILKKLERIMRLFFFYGKYLKPTGAAMNILMYL